MAAVVEYTAGELFSVEVPGLESCWRQVALKAVGDGVLPFPREVGHHLNWVIVEVVVVAAVD